MLCALKCDLREEHEKDEPEAQQLIQYNEGLEVAKRIGALRYLGRLGVFQVESDELTVCRVLSNEESRRQ